jgi:outer membrane protein
MMGRQSVGGVVGEEFGPIQEREKNRRMSDDYLEIRSRLEMKALTSTDLSDDRLVRVPKTALATGLLFATMLVATVLPGAPLAAQEGRQVIDLTLERMVDLTLSTSYSIRRLNMDIQREQYNLQAERANLKSSVNMDLTMPRFNLTSEPRWNSTLNKFQIEQEHSRRWEGQLSVRQPVILFGYPTNGYLSVNNNMYQYTQFEDDGTKDTDYYNRYYISYSQPLFQPNSLKNNLEQAEMSLESSQLEFYGDVIGMVDGVARTYFGLFEEHYGRTISLDLVANLERALTIARELSVVDSARTIDVDQVQVELANALEDVQSAESSIRSRSSSVKRDLGLSEADSIAITHVIQVDPVFVDMDEAVRFAMELTPRMRQLDISERNSVIRHEETKGRGGFEMNLNFSYGREKRDDEFGNLWQEPDNSYTVNVTADVPIWDWGERKARIAASEITLQQSFLRREEQELEIVSNVRNEVLNVRDRESRTLAMQANMELAREVSETSFQRYQTGQITVLDLILSLRREADTVENFLDAYLSWKESLRSLRRQTYYDYEEGIPVLERFGVQDRLPGDGLLGISLPKATEGLGGNREN